MSQRKLLQEIDKVFKKVKEGLEIFDGYYDKLQNCESQSQKEKIEGDLKREIKKLQRQRDQIKNWLSGNEVKDKKNLLENRRLIENAMERFKTVEKDMKTKAFSKEGLSMQRIDPKQKEKNESSDFLHQMLEELERQCEKHEATIDQIQSSGKKGKKLDGAKQQEIEDLTEKISRNHWHQEKMEQMLRLLANDDIECEQVNGLQEDIKYYVESNEDADFAEDEGIYDELGLEDIEDMYGHVGDYPQAAPEDEIEQEAPIVDPSPQKKPSVSSHPSATNVAASASSTSVNTISKLPPPGLPQPSTTSSTTNLKPSVTPLKTDLKYSSVLSAGVQSNNNTPIATQAPSISTPPISNAALNNNTNNNNFNHNNISSTAASSPQVAPPGLTKTSSITTDQSRETTQSPVLIPSGFQDLIPSFEKSKQNISKPPPLDEISKILETSLLNCPDSLDADKPKTYSPLNPHPTSVYYPQEPLPELSYSSIVSKLDLSTLFYNFYYEQNQYIQILSARELVKKGWAFDKLSKHWFQEVEEIQPPNIVNDQIIHSEKKIAWKYFDNDGVWLPRRKEDVFNPEQVQLETNF